LLFGLVVWEAKVSLLTGISVTYKYIIIGLKDKMIVWESKKPYFRSVVPLGYEMVINDGEFGKAEPSRKQSNHYTPDR